MEVNQKIQQWVEFDNKLKSINDMSIQLRKKRAIIASQITSHYEKTGIPKAEIPIPDGYLKIVNSTVQPTLSYKHLEKCLREIIKNENQVKQIIDYVKLKRETQVVPEIKRYSTL